MKVAYSFTKSRWKWRNWLTLLAIGHVVVYLLSIYIYNTLEPALWYGGIALLPALIMFFKYQAAKETDQSFESLFYTLVISVIKPGLVTTLTMAIIFSVTGAVKEAWGHILSEMNLFDAVIAQLLAFGLLGLIMFYPIYTTLFLWVQFFRQKNIK